MGSVHKGHRRNKMIVKLPHLIFATRHEGSESMTTLEDLRYTSLPLPFLRTRKVLYVITALDL